ncbi:hypothetical protein ACFL0C_02005 [Patescibacteria group bacterium]
MQRENILKSLINLPLELQFGVVALLGILFILTIKMRHSNRFKEKVLKSKNVKREIVKYLFKNLESLDYLSKKLANDKEIVHEFNTETALLALKSTNNIERLVSKLNVLEDNELSSLIDEYTTEAKYIVSSIYNLETDIYEKHKEYQQRLRQYEREFHILSNEEKIPNEKIAELRTAFKNEMQAYKEKVKILEDTYAQNREELAKHLLKTNVKNHDVQRMLLNYKKKEVDSRKLYIKELVYA